jgi:hypothetical protein
MVPLSVRQPNKLELCHSHPTLFPATTANMNRRQVSHIPMSGACCHRKGPVATVANAIPPQPGQHEFSRILRPAIPRVRAPRLPTSLALASWVYRSYEDALQEPCFCERLALPWLPV